jgi:hypothetical protein
METEETEMAERGLTTIIVAGTTALANLTDEQFAARLAAITKGQERILAMQKSLLVEGVDYANIPDVKTPALGKPGAEKLCLAYGLVVRVETDLVIGDGVTAPAITWDATAHFYLTDFDGPEVGIGHGTCNSFERKYRYRNDSLKCPECGKALRHSKAPRTGWYCWREKGGCGWQTANDDEPVVKSQNVGQVDNPDPFDLSNTIMKIAEKRAHVDGTLRVTASSGIFTQDLEENVAAPETAPTETARTSASSGSGVSVARPASGTQGAVAQAAPTDNEPPPFTDAEIVDYIDGKSPDRDAAAPPYCPNGHGQMAVSNFGGFWCKTKDCKEKVR